jgi:hypothetical protein
MWVRCGAVRGAAKSGRRGASRGYIREVEQSSAEQSSRVEQSRLD